MLRNHLYSRSVKKKIEIFDNFNYKNIILRKKS